MAVTTYKNVVEGTEFYQRIIDLIGKCQEEGGHVELSHHIKQLSGKVFENTMNVKIFWHEEDKP